MYRNALQRGPLASLLNSVRGAAKGVTIANPSADVLPFKGAPVTNKPIKWPATGYFPYVGFDEFGVKDCNVKLAALEVALESGKSYSWCSCGLSKTQPFCDGAHKMEGATEARPVRFQVEKSGEYYMCNCKQTTTRPICDGSHKEVSATPKDFYATRFVAFGDNSPVYDGVARKLGYKPKGGGFQ